jgi:hypothetical protein
MFQSSTYIECPENSMYQISYDSKVSVMNFEINVA